MNGDKALIADLAQCIDQRGKVDASLFPDWNLSKGDPAAAPGIEVVWAIGCQQLILQVDIEDMRGETTDGFQTIGLATEFEIGRFVDQAEVGPVDTLQDFERPVDFFEETFSVALVGQAEVALGGFVGSAARPGDILIGFETDAQEWRTELFSEVEVGCDIAQGERPLIGIFGDREVAGHHRDGQVVLSEESVGGGDDCSRAVGADLGSAHTERLVSVVGSKCCQFLEGHIRFALSLEFLSDADRK